MKNTLIAGVDEVGRGPIAGPIVAAAVILDNNNFIEGIKDSKKLSAKRREQLSELIKKKSLCYALGRAEVEEIDEINIFQASLLAMQRAVLALSMQPDEVLVDGKYCPKLPYICRAIVKGDQTQIEISAASIIAKVARDAEMIALDNLYSGYGFAQHKGYPTAQHLSALKKLGACIIHRRSFSPVSKVISQANNNFR